MVLPKGFLRPRPGPVKERARWTGEPDGVNGEVGAVCAVGDRALGSGVGQHHSQSPSRRSRRPKKRPTSHRTLPRGLTTKIHMVAADARTAIIYALSPGQDHDGPHGRQLLRKAGNPKQMDPRIGWCQYSGSVEQEG